MSRRLLVVVAIVAGIVAAGIEWNRQTAAREAPVSPEQAPAVSSPASLEAPAETLRRSAEQPAESLAFRVAHRVMRDARYAALVTQDGTGGATVRTIDPLLPDSAMVVWFATNPASRKVQELARDARVVLYYFDVRTSAYVSLYGDAHQARSAAEKEEHWKPEWTPFYPDRDRSVVMYEVQPRRLEVVSPGEGVEGDTLTWAPPTYIPPRRGGR